MLARSSTRVSLVLAPVLAVLAGTGCKKDPETRAEPTAGARDGSTSADPEPAGPAVHVTVSVDWEGAYFDQEALDAMDRFRTRYPGVPLTHFLNAAYYTKPGVDPIDPSREMKLAIKPGDGVGLHIHMWKTLVEAAGVKFRDGPSFLSAEGELLEFEDDIGFDVDPSAYTVEELRKVIGKSREILENEHFELEPLFRAGGWIGTPNVLEAVRAEGFTIDSSATDPDWLDGEDSQVQLQKRVREVWPNIDQTSQPFVIDTPAGEVLEMPDTGALADHMSAEDMVSHVTAAHSRAANSPQRPIFVHLGFHAETAHHFLPALEQALDTLKKQKVAMRFETLSASAEAARKLLAESKPE